MDSPYLMRDKSIISFSGGRTSGYMLNNILQAHDGVLPDFVKVIFANTGKESPKTLDFVQECSERWNVQIVWVEFDPSIEEGFQIVNHNSACRAGEPYEALIDKKKFLPNPTMRFCTTELKIRPMKKYITSVLGWEHWDNVIGLRYDEPRRVHKKLNSTTKERWEIVMPLHHAKVTKWTVRDFWKAQPFDLRLVNINGKTPEGNCDMCFLKGARAIQTLIKNDPESAAWWIKQESKQFSGPASGNRFRNDRPSYAEMAVLQELNFGGSDELEECFCHD